MRIGFDLSPLHRPFPPGVVRAVSESVRALRDRSHIDVVDLIPPPQGELRTWRKTLPARVGSEKLVGLHSFTSAYPKGGPGKRVQTIHELPWRHGVKENADWRHRYWASLGARGADRVLCPTEHVASDLRKTWFAPKDRVRVVPWGQTDHPDDASFVSPATGGGMQDHGQDGEGKEGESVHGPHWASPVPSPAGRVRGEIERRGVPRAEPPVTKAPRTDWVAC